MLTFMITLHNDKEDRLIILLNSFQKKTPKTPKKEIELAEKLKKEYFKEKEARNG